ncbi:MAG: hypothetical protein GFH27_549293n285 [Chloroflexi bacterium AL-W]|nr:hypothetical protein [Chloroflexi bacterium AL-N1]NOK67600.1 hypothetical protein [Chloroflexi bacterium AL-N10]NOK75630.1 hypothetical protein [Chloroflexi bacterium AL-N5]NOK82418.1 hypothetical protein [Chloroflexi bacterium AL-W]NOK90263.1 hypothetical protein [Chloroflexi bacterium AL-N15]
MQWFKQFFTHTPSPISFDASDPATDADLEYCYRLILRRPPDEAGLAFWRTKIIREKLSVGNLVDGFISSNEFTDAHNNIKYVPMMISGETLHTVEFDNFLLCTSKKDYIISTSIENSHQYEPAVSREIQCILESSQVFVDVGANIGYFSLLAASIVGPNGHVYAFEPNPDNCSLLRFSAAQNHFKHITVYQNAVADVAQTYILETEGSNGRIVSAQQASDTDSFTNNNPTLSKTLPRLYVTSVRLDDVLSELHTIDVIKIDIEGAEPRAIQGMQELVHKHRPVIISEFAPDLLKVTSGVAPEQYLKAFTTLGYTLFVIEEDSIKPIEQDYQQLEARYFTEGVDHIDIVARPQ